MSKDFIISVMEKDYSKDVVTDIFDNSPLIQYLEKKTKSVNRGSKARGSFANIYAIYVLTEDYINHGYDKPSSDYSKYEGMTFTNALTRTRELPFGEKLQNHALNDRCNDEFRKFFNTVTDEVPIIRNLNTRRYWINEDLLLVETQSAGVINISRLCLDIIDKYVELKRAGFSSFFDELNEQKKHVDSNPNQAISFILGTLSPNSDARIFEIASYVIIKYYYIKQTVRFSIEGSVEKELPLTVYKVGRTNANDGGIDFVMKPLGRIFQVTEVLDFKKYFLDIDKLIHYPITFVVKQNISSDEALQKIYNDATLSYSQGTVDDYMDCFEEIITIPRLKEMLEENIHNGFLPDMVDEFIVQCKVEYNFE